MRIEPLPWDPAWVQVWTGPNSYRVMTAEDAKKLVEPEEPEGRLQVIARDPNKHDEARYGVLYGPMDERPFDVIMELDHPVAEKEWKEYSHEGGRRGPRPFRSMLERKTYLRRYGFAED